MYIYSNDEYQLKYEHVLQQKLQLAIEAHKVMEKRLEGKEGLKKPDTEGKKKADEKGVLYYSHCK